MTTDVATPSQIDWAGQVVLLATRIYKSSYGRFSNYRFYAASRETSITEAEWDAAKQLLIARGLVKSSGAITEDGRTAVAQFTSLSSLRRSDS